jgi:Tfp pilus assembly protein PilF
VCFRRLRPWLLAALLSVSCSREGERGVLTLAILPFENLTGRPEFDWISRGLAEAVRLQLAGTARFEPVAISALRDAETAHAERTLHGYFSVLGGRLDVRAVVENTATRRMVRTAAASGPASGGPVPLSSAIAHDLEASARAVPTASAAALEAYVTALNALDQAVADRDFERAVAADPGFGAAYLGWAEALIARGGRDRAVQVLAAAHANASRFPELERVRLSFLGAALSGDREGERAALVALTRADPADASVCRSLGELDTARHDYTSSAKWYEQAAARDPHDVNVLNQLGYVHAWAGDLDGAVKALTRYRDLRPNEANPLDSLGDANYYLGRFAEAEKQYAAAHAANTSFLAGGDLYKGAWARLMQDNVGGADELFARFLEARTAAGDIVPFRQAQWEYVTGRRRAAVARLEQFAQSAPPQTAAPAWCALTLWSLEAGDRARAQGFAAKAGSTPLGALFGFLAEPAAPAAEGAARAAQILPAPPQAGLRKLATAYALLLARDFRGATAPLEESYAASNPASPDWPAVPLAWALVENDDFARARQLVAFNPVPDPTGELPFLSLSFPRIFYLRAVVADKENRRGDAKRNYSMFLKFAGDLPDAFGERARAAAALSR